MCLLPAAKKSVDGITALFCFLASERSHSWVESDCGMWPIWATCLKYGICFSDGFLGVTHPSMSRPCRFEGGMRYCLGGSQVSLKVFDFFIQKWGEFGLDLKSPSSTYSTEKSLRTVFSAQWGICHFVLHILVIWGHKAGRTNVSHHRPGLPPSSSRWQP